jgi:hypothetical protein
MTRRQALADAALAVAVTAFAATVTALYGNQFSTADRSVDRWAVLLVTAGGLVLAGRRRAPFAVLAATVAATGAYLLLSYPYGPVFLSLVVAVYTVARHRPLRPALAACAAALPLLLAHVVTHPDALPGWLGLIPGSAWVAVPFVVGATLRMAREADDRAREEALRAGVMDERLRLA